MTASIIMTGRYGANAMTPPASIPGVGLPPATVGQLRSVGHPNHCPKADNGIAIAPPLNIRTLQY